MFLSQFIEKVQETPTDWSFRFTIPEGFSYSAGQYSVIRVDLKYPDSLHNARTCSLSSAPTEPYLQFTFTIRGSGFKRTLMEMEPGCEVTLYRVRGKMTADYVTTPHCVMIAGGIGIAPFRGIIKHLYDISHPLQVTLLYSDKTIDELAFYKEFQEISQRHQFFTPNYTLTRHDPSHGEWYDRVGRINTRMVQEVVDDGDDVTYMVCGPDGMVRHSIAELQAIGVPQERIVSEIFTGY